MIFLPRRKIYTKEIYLVVHQVPGDLSGSRADRFIQNRYPEFSRNKIHQIFKKERIRISRLGKELSQGLTQTSTVSDQSIEHTIRAALELSPVRPSTRVYEGDEVVVVTHPKPGQVFQNHPELHAVYEDENLLVINKPSGITVHPGGAFLFNSLITHLQENFQTKEDFYLCHRLDRETSGLLVIAKTRETASKVSHFFQKSDGRDLQKDYYAVVHGHIPEKHFSITAPLGKDPESEIRLKMATLSKKAGGLSSRTDFQVLERFTSPSGHPLTALRCQLFTGRQHQIRVHLLSKGYPIVGDKLYGVPETIFFKTRDQAPTEEDLKTLLLPRHALHAWKMALPHPIKPLKLELTAPIPSDLGTLKSPSEALHS